MVCANVVVEVYMLAMSDGLSRGLRGGQWNAFPCRLANEEGVWGKRRLWHSGDWAIQNLDAGGTGHLLAL